MSCSPDAKYLVISRAIEARILSDHPAGQKLPSTRDIAVEHGVSIVTASRALQVLRDKGLIETSGRSRSVLVGQPGVPVNSTLVLERFGLLLRSTPGPWQAASRSVPMKGFLAAAKEQGIQVEHERFELDDLTSVAEVSRQIRWAVDLGVKGVFLMPARHSEPSARQDEAFLTACQQAGIGVVLVERNLRGLARALDHDLVATDDLDGGMVSTQHLIEQGRKRVAFVTGSPTSSHEGRVAGYLMAMYHASRGTGPARKPIVFEQRSGLPTKDAYEELADRVVAAKVDGVVCYQDYTAVGLMIELLTRRLQVPQDVAITGFDNLPIGNSFALGVTTYEYPALAIARQAIRVMRARLQDRDAPVVKVIVPGKLIVRESSGS